MKVLNGLDSLNDRLNNSRFCPYKRDSVTRFFASGFFHESVSPQPQSTPLGPFYVELFRKFAEIFVSQGATGINDTGGKFASK
jgi:hypothetical protein